MLDFLNDQTLNMSMWIYAKEYLPLIPSCGRVDLDFHLCISWLLGIENTIMGAEDTLLCMHWAPAQRSP